MYCVKCKRETQTTDLERTVTKNNRNLLRGHCTVCGKVKTQFIKSEYGMGLKKSR